MRHRQGMWISAAVALLCTAALATADCVPAFQAVSSIGVFPSRMAGPVATNDSILGMAKTDAESATNAIDFATYHSDLAQLTPDVKAADASLNGAAALFWTGGEFSLFYQAPSLALMLQRIDESGSLVGGPIPIANHSWSTTDEFDVTWVGARESYAVVHNVTGGSDRGLWVTVIGRSGTVAFDMNLTVLVNGPAFPHVVALPDGTLEIAWFRPGEMPALMLSSVSPAGTLTALPLAEREISDLRLAANGSSILIIDQAVAAGGTQLRYSQVGSGGGVVARDSFFLSGSGVDIAPRWLLWNAALSEWALVYVDAPAGPFVPGDMRFRRFTAPAGLASDTLLADTVYSRLAATSPPVFLDGGYIASIGRRRSHAEGSESYLVKSCPFFVTASADHPIWSPFVPITFTAHPSGGVPGFTYTWDFGDLSTQSGAVVRHAYNLPGVYAITLTATDAAGAQSVYKFTVQVVVLRHRAVR